MRWLYNFLKLFFVYHWICKCFIKMEEEQWMYNSIMFEEVDMNIENEEDAGVKVEHVDCSNAFNTSQVFV